MKLSLTASDNPNYAQEANSHPSDSFPLKKRRCQKKRAGAIRIPVIFVSSGNQHILSK
jgi:hypothetical protein